MATIVRRDLAKGMRIAERDPASLVVVVGAGENKKAKRADVVQIGIRVAQSALASKLEQAITQALDDVGAAPLPTPRVVRVISRKALDGLGAGVEGAFAIVPVTSKNLRRAFDIVEGLRRGRALGVQLVWDGRTPSRDVAEPKIFAILERARATPSDAPVVLSSGDELVESLRILARRDAISAP